MACDVDVAAGRTGWLAFTLSALAGVSPPEHFRDKFNDLVECVEPSRHDCDVFLDNFLSHVYTDLPPPLRHTTLLIVAAMAGSFGNSRVRICHDRQHHINFDPVTDLPKPRQWSETIVTEFDPMHEQRVGGTAAFGYLGSRWVTDGILEAAERDMRSGMYGWLNLVPYLDEHDKEVQVMYRTKKINKIETFKSAIPRVPAVSINLVQISKEAHREEAAAKAAKVDYRPAVTSNQIRELARRGFRSLIRYAPDLEMLRRLLTDDLKSMIPILIPAVCDRIKNYTKNFTANPTVFPFAPIFAVALS